jgi:recombination protein RecA
MAVNAELLKVINKINKKMGADTIILGENIQNTIGRFTTGSLSFDVALGGGWPVNQWHELIGEESNGKTAVALKTVAANQARDPEFTTVW